MGKDKAGFTVSPTGEQSTAYWLLDIEELVLYNSCQNWDDCWDAKIQDGATVFGRPSAFALCFIVIVNFVTFCTECVTSVSI